MWRPRGRAQGPLRRRHRSAAARTASRPRTTSRRTTGSRTSPSWRRATSVRARPAATRRSSAPTTGRQRGPTFYKESVKLYEGLSVDLDFNLLFSQQGHLTLAHSDRGDDHGDRAGRGEPAARDRQPGHLPGRDRASSARRWTSREDVTWPVHGRALPPARRDHPPRRRRLGLRARRGPAGRRDPPLHRGDRDQALERARHRRRDEPRRHRLRHGRQRARPAGRPSSPISPAYRSRSRPTSSRRSSPSR